MTNESPAQNPARVGLIAQIVTAALMGGVLTFAAVTVVIGKGEPAPNPLISIIAVGFATVSAVLHFIVPSLLVGAQKESLRAVPEDGRLTRLAGLYFTQVIVGMALLEGAGFFNLVAVLLEHHFWSYGVVAVVLVLMALRFPSQGRFEDWADHLNHELNY